MSDIRELIRNKQNISEDELIRIIVLGDGNCLYRTFSYFLYENEEHHKELRKIIYEQAKNHKDQIKEFFLEDEADEVLEDYKLNAYIENIKENFFYGGIIELSIFARYLNLNIFIYTKINDDDNFYTYFLNISKNENNNNFILIEFYNDNHYNLLRIKNENTIIKNKNSKTKVCKNNLIIDYNHKNNIIKIKTNDFVIIENKENFYNDIYKYLLSKKSNTYDNKINWKNVYYPKIICDEKVKTKKDKKKQNFRLQADKYTIGDDNRLYLKKLNLSNKIELYKIPFQSEVFSLFYKNHDLKGHINYKRIINEIKESKYTWKSLRCDALNYVKECADCIKSKGGKPIKSMPKKIEVKGPKER